MLVYCALQLYIRQFGDLGNSVIANRRQQSPMAILATVWGTPETRIQGQNTLDTSRATGNQLEKRVVFSHSTFLRQCTDQLTITNQEFCMKNCYPYLQTKKFSYYGHLFETMQPFTLHGYLLHCLTNHFATIITYEPGVKM